MRRHSALMVGLAISLLGGVVAWRSANDITSPTGPGATEPNLSVGPNGHVYMSWLEPADSGFALRVSSFNGKRWTPVRTVRTGTNFFVNWADFPSVVSLGGNRLAVHWLQRAGSGTYAYHVKIAQSNDDGVTWSAPVTPHRDSSATEHGFAAMWRDGNELGAVWLDGRKYDKAGHDPSNEMSVVSTSLGRSGRRGAEVTLDGRACDCCQTSAAMTTRGPIIAYRDRSPQEIRDIHVVRRVGGRWTPSKAVHDDHWKINACPVNGPAIDARGNRVAVAWFTAANDSARVKLAFSVDAGASFAPPVRIDGGAPGGRVDVAQLRDGSALVSWIERVGGDTAAVRVRRVSSAGRTGAPVTIATSSAARASGFPQMAVMGNDVVFAWTVPGRPSSVKVARAPLSAFQ